jgi:molybdopterin converting factor small subunit
VSTTVVLPGALRELAEGRATLDLGGGVATVREALVRLRERAPAVYDRVVTETGAVRQHVNVFVGSADIRWAGGLETPVPAGSEVVILPAVSGG